jgi:hypothetical protein
MENKSILTLFFQTILLGIILIILSFVYVYLSDLNPIVYLNFIIWWFFGAILTLPISLLAKKHIAKIAISFVVSSITIYLVYGMKSSIFSYTVESAFLYDSSMWIPKVNFSDLYSTLTSLTNYNEKLNFLLEFDTLNLSFKASKSVDTGSGFTNFIRIIECLGLYIIPIYIMIKNKDKNATEVIEKDF